MGSEVLNNILCAGYWKNKVMAGSVEHAVPGDCNIGGSTLLLGVGLPSPPALTLLCWVHFLASRSILLQLWELILPGSSLVEINYSPICQQPQ